MGDKRKSGHLQYDWDSFDDQYDKVRFDRWKRIRVTMLEYL